ncbi:CCR4-Not complex subunit Ccr4 [Schizosaccharomyces japonicus yFS275]|uniref:CCR4-Not complex 3'-5'-exoribonuclease subunit Ccr4 n=1 Tax=Schizosaccharomyces japonicus (strain yFS275 / FY16936) TaxID=402676 RepID=B6K0I4_SCHJY|nr:CCR4-Not complex subunit Ccr4 [Schizosaccharomyces japonicus yFS275]EEB07455.2 CCR4-Not complex subunit Ccr4 [Schizosaccharomyces japonicus yFS275]
MFNTRYNQGPIYSGTHPRILTPDTQHATILPVHNSPIVESSKLTDHWKQQISLANQSRAFSSPHQRAHNAAALSRGAGMGYAGSYSGTVTPAGGVSNSAPFSNGSPGPKMNADANKNAGTVSAQNDDAKNASNTKTKSERQDWSCLDMGGVGLRSLSVELFRFTFLTELYINHNNLTRLPPEIGKLRSLVVLDASEGNPLQDFFKNQIMENGTAGLIATLRDGCPVSAPPSERKWEKLDSEDTNDGVNDLRFTVMSYNVLCERYATPVMYGYTPSWALAWSYRKELIMQEIVGYSADIICLQEVDVENYDSFFAPKMSLKGYKGVHYPKSRVRTMNEAERRVVDGCATFFKTSKFVMHDKILIEFNQAPSLRRQDIKLTPDMYNRVMTKDNISILTMLESKDTGTKLIVANCHIHWDPQFRDVKLMQVAMLMDELAQAASDFQRSPSKLPDDHFDGSTRKKPSYTHYSKIPVLICGDFNSVPGSGVLDFLSSGMVERKHEDFMEHDYGDYTVAGRSHTFSLKSAYSANNDLPFTNFTPGFSGTIDYVWYTNNSLEVTGLLKGVDPDYLSTVVGFPNPHFPSDHICLLAEFKVKNEKSHPSFDLSNDKN